MAKKYGNLVVTIKPGQGVAIGPDVLVSLSDHSTDNRPPPTAKFIVTAPIETKIDRLNKDEMQARRDKAKKGEADEETES